MISWETIKINASKFLQIIKLIQFSLREVKFRMNIILKRVIFHKKIKVNQIH